MKLEGTNAMRASTYKVKHFWCIYVKTDDVLDLILVSDVTLDWSDLPNLGHLISGNFQRLEVP